ncbi:MAG: DNA gyrase inhibitor YacG [Burkholderiales bacterium]|nr:DNA gyrase inhibitor YacG [Burkholderiales bacterium]
MSASTPPRIIACPVCGKATAFAPSNRWRPFCGERCRTSDLGAWACETYRIPAPPGEDDAASPDESADRLK